MNPDSPVTPADRLEMVRIVKEILGEEKSVLWWKTPNPMLGGISPMWMSASPAERRLRNFIFDAHEDNRASIQVDDART